MHFTHHTYIQNTPSPQKLKQSFFVLAFLLLTGCSSESANQSSAKSNADSNSESSQAYNLSPELKTVFNETCAQCHTRDSSGAPNVGDSKAWDKILSKGMDATLDRVMNGYGGMPPAGQCFECSPDQLVELIRYMSSEA